MNERTVAELRRLSMFNQNSPDKDGEAVSVCQRS